MSKKRKMGHRDTDVVERRREEKEERQKHRKVINPTELLCIQKIQFVPTEKTHSARYNRFQLPLTCSHEYHYSHHKKYTSIFVCTLYLKHT